MRGAFGALQKYLTHKHIDLKVKWRKYEAICLSLLLHRHIHHRCVNTMRRVAIVHLIVVVSSYSSMNYT
jgi:hypothetical protein